MADPIWRPSPARIEGSILTRFMRETAARERQAFHAYSDLHRWSVEHPGEFWACAWDFFDVVGDRGDRLIANAGAMPGARFLPDASLNFAENLLRRGDDTPAIIATSESGRDRELSWAALRQHVSRAAAALREAGVRPGDRVAGLVTNVPEAVIAALATASIGAVWSSCSPDFGADGITDRFGQIAPVVLIAVSGYEYGGRRFDCRPKIREVAARLSGLRTLVIVEGPERIDRIDPVEDDARPVPALPKGVQTRTWDEWLARAPETPLAFPRMPFDHPLYILYSSGTTGVPKCIVHGTGGTLLQHMKEHQLHSDVRRGDRVFYFTTCGWMMWNWLVSALASEAALVLYDGSPVHPGPARLFDLADSAAITLLGVSARFIDSTRKSGLEPRRTHRLTTVRTITSTGSPLAPESFDFVYKAIKADVHLASISGGTDIVSCFMLGNPNGPVWRGELQAAGLGLDVQVFDDQGRPVRGQPGELVCAAPFPSMPVAFWNDPAGEKYRAAYFERFPGVWTHGDWVASTDHDGFIVYGRSDATLNPGGVRIGTAEIYRQVEEFPEVLESVAVGQPWQGDERIILFVRLAPGRVLDDDLRRRIVDRLRTHASPRHVPARIVQVADVPRTRSGKTVEIAIRRVIAGRPVDNREALANPESLELYRDVPELQT